jgi:hypothetical protein
MKKLLFLFSLFAMMLVVTPIIAFGANESPSELQNPFVSFIALSAAIPFIAEIVIRLFRPPTGLWTQIVSIIVGVGVTLLGWLFNLGFLSDLLWWHAIIVGLSASLAANGIWDIGLYEAILKAIGILKQVDNRYK